jgi:DNA repair ATPase RecN
MDNVERRLDEMTRARRKLGAKVSESLEVLGEIEEQINEVKERQVDRLRKDTRVDESIVDQVQGD